MTDVSGGEPRVHPDGPADGQTPYGFAASHRHNPCSRCASAACHSRYGILVMPLDVPAHLLEKLQALRAAKSHRDEIEDRQNAFLLDPGLGPELYLTSNGRVLSNDPEGFWGDAGLHEMHGIYVWRAIAVGAAKTGIAELLDLLPPRPTNGHDCSRCNGTGWMPMKDAAGGHGSIVCLDCNGLGWTT